MVAWKLRWKPGRQVTKGLSASLLLSPQELLVQVLHLATVRLSPKLWFNLMLQQILLFYVGLSTFYVTTSSEFGELTDQVC